MSGFMTHTMIPTETRLASDCSNCADLCCVAYTFDKSESFGLDKATDEPCPNLSKEGGCKIHTALMDKGFSGCLQYQCHGAGPRVLHEMFGGQGWQGDPVRMAAMTAALRQLVPLHARAALLDYALRFLPLPAVKAAEVSELRDQMLAPTDDMPDTDLLIAQAQVMLHGLRDYAPKR